MAAIDFKKIPRFKQLPIRKGAPPESSWGVFGNNDEFGCLNFLTPQGIVDAAKLVKKGKVFRLDTPINYAKPPLFNRNPARHTILSFEQYGLLGHDDSIDNYNSVTDDQIKDGPGGRLSIHKWADRFVGRGLLIDACKYLGAKKRAVVPLSAGVYKLKDLQDALKAQGTKVKPGSILLVRTGWLGAYLKASDQEKKEMAPLEALKSCGIEPTSAMVEWLWDNRFAAIGTDCPAVEPWPWDFRDEGALHYRTLSLLGLPLGEQFVLDDLAADCAKDKRYEFLLVSVPMNLEGGIASPPNAVAIK